MSSAASGRIVCSRCGANNFDTQAACWKCGVPLIAGAAMSPPPPSVAPSSRPPSSMPRPSQGDAAPSPPILPTPYRSTTDPTVAVWSAIALAVFFPYIAVPVGIVFLMLDDRRKIEVGRVALIAGLAFSLVQTLISMWFFKAAWNEVQQFLPQLGGRAAASAQSIQDARQPRPNDPLPPSVTQELHP